MSALLRIRDEVFGKPAADDPPPTELRLVSERVSPREIIRQRVFAEVAEVNERRLDHVQQTRRTRSLLIDVDDASPEALLNPAVKSGRRPAVLLDAEAELAKALTAFAKNRFIMLFDDRQVDGLEDDLTVMPGSEVTFVHLVPLKGG
jgi:hypothetical protein